HSSSASGTEAFRWENGIMEGLGFLPGDSAHSRAIAVSDDGSVIVGISEVIHGDGEIIEPVFKVFIWTRESGMKDLKIMLEDEYNFDLEGWEFNSVRDISADGKVIIGRS